MLPRQRCSPVVTPERHVLDHRVVDLYRPVHERVAVDAAVAKDLDPGGVGGVGVGRIVQLHVRRAGRHDLVEQRSLDGQQLRERLVGIVVDAPVIDLRAEHRPAPERQLPGGRRQRDLERSLGQRGQQPRLRGRRVGDASHRPVDPWHVQRLGRAVAVAGHDRLAVHGEPVECAVEPHPPGPAIELAVDDDVDAGLHLSRDERADLGLGDLRQPAAILLGALPPRVLAERVAARKDPPERVDHRGGTHHAADQLGPGGTTGRPRRRDPRLR